MPLWCGRKGGRMRFWSKCLSWFRGDSTWFHEGTSAWTPTPLPMTGMKSSEVIQWRHVRSHHSFTRDANGKVEVFRHIPRYLKWQPFGIEFGISHPIWTAGFCLLKIWTPLARLATAAQAHLWIGYMTSCRAQMREKPAWLCKSQVGFGKNQLIQQKTISQTLLQTTP